MTETAAAARKNFIQRLRTEMEASDMSNVQLADLLGYDHPNIISMFRSGKTRVPLAKVPALARALGLDARELLRAWFRAYQPDDLPVIEMHFGAPAHTGRVLPGDPNCLPAA